MFVCVDQVCCCLLQHFALPGILYRANQSAIWLRFDSHEKVIELSGYGTLDATMLHTVTVTCNTMSVQRPNKPLNWASNVSQASREYVGHLPAHTHMRMHIHVHDTHVHTLTCTHMHKHITM